MKEALQKIIDYFKKPFTPEKEIEIKPTPKKRKRYYKKKTK